ncbi:MAG: respiratory nitrate reductase subunit gamma [Planctomycetota bacterium]
MQAMRLVVGGLLPYVAFLVFLGGMVHRIRTWRRLPSPAITLFPAPLTPADNRLNALQEAVLFRSLFRGDALLWAIAWVFHVMLALIAIGHLRVVADVDGLFRGLGMSEADIQSMSSSLGGAAGIIVLVALVLLGLRHVMVSRVREITGPADYIALALIAAIVLTGNRMRFGSEHFDLGLTREYVRSLLTLGDVTSSEALHNGPFVLHMLLALLLIMFIPFSKLLHFGGIFFTHTIVRKR